MKIYLVSVTAKFQVSDDTYTDFINIELKISADDVEHAISKCKDRLWEFIDGIRSPNEVIFDNIRIHKADVIGSVDF